VGKPVSGRQPRRGMRRELGFILPLVMFLVLASTGPARAATSHTPRGWVPHSAYGIQVSIPRSWKVTYFSPCPRTDTLNIGAANYGVNCPSFDSSGPWLGIYSTSPGQPLAGVPFPAYSAPRGYHFPSLTVNGLHVLRPPSSPSVVAWLVPSKRAVVIGSGPKASSVLHTLAPATRRSVPALGAVTGHVYLEVVTQLPVTGPVTVTSLKSHKTRTLDAFDGGWGATLAPGHYTATGHDGDAVCPPVKFTVPSGLRVTAPAIRCQGM
jgi:hypothetical protein